MPRRLLAALAGLPLMMNALRADAAEFRILRFEPLVVSEVVQPRTVGTRGAATTRGSALRFRAFGTDFALELEPNDRVNAALPAAQRATIVALRGSVAGRPGSWVRLTRERGQFTGMIHDGRELYSVEPVATARPYIGSPPAMPETGQVIYRMSDTLTDLQGEFCGVRMVPGVTTQADVFQALATQLQTDEVASLVATKQVEVGLVADFELWGRYGDSTAATVATRMNVVDGIFSSQLAVHLSVRSITTYSTDTDPFDTSDSNSLLNELRDYRIANPVQFINTGLTHLMTGRDIADNGNATTVGVAFVNALCGNSAVSVSEGSRSNATAALIAAHEIGHNFGAQHDGEEGSACAATPQTYIMAPQLSASNTTFSECSLDTMRPATNRSCVAALAQADAALQVPATAPLAQDQPTLVTFNVLSLGPGPVSESLVQVSLPPGIIAVGAGAEGGTCPIFGTSQISCTLAGIPAGEQREVQLTLLGLASGTGTANLTLTTAGDGNSANNTAQIELVTGPGADVSVAISAVSTAIQTSTTSVATITVNNLSAVAAPGTRMTATLPAGLTAVSVAANALGCTIDSASAFACPTVTLAAGATQTVALTVRGTTAGSRRLAVAVTSQLGDPNAANNSAGVTFTVSDPVVVVTPAPAPASTSGDGGGGALGAELAALGLLLALMSRRRLQIRA